MEAEVWLKHLTEICMRRKTAAYIRIPVMAGINTIVMDPGRRLQNRKEHRVLLLHDLEAGLLRVPKCKVQHRTEQEAMQMPEVGVEADLEVEAGVLGAAEADGVAEAALVVAAVEVLVVEVLEEDNVITPGVPSSLSFPDH
jgi:hypothetical protein